MPRGRPKGSIKKITDKIKELAPKKLSPLKAIRAKCMECSGGQYSEIKMCTCTNCPLYAFRAGNNPNRTGKGGLVNNGKEISEDHLEPDEDDFGKEDMNG